MDAGLNLVVAIALTVNWVELSLKIPGEVGTADKAIEYSKWYAASLGMVYFIEVQSVVLAKQAS
ncbi:MAG: hypothetical protein J1F05_07155 [Muribaculaceae bacterium]|nr:hypothetical protein [Muribaculaceae bacterium]